jgi:D-alanyl-D-alanine carboxypeptidase
LSRSRRNVRRLVSAATVALLAAAFGAAGAGGQTAPSADGALARAMNRLVAMPGGPPGVAVIVQRGERRSFMTAGVSSVDGGGRWRVGDHMRIVCVAKAFSGAAALSLVALRRVDALAVCAALAAR